MSVEYHQRELAIALDPSNPARAMPPILPKHKRILDVGCGMGQSLLAAQLPSDTEAYGVDCDIEAIEAGRRLAPPNIKFVCAGGENLPFEDKYFDLVISINTLHNLYNYDLHAAFGEIERVGRGAKYICVEAYRNEREKVNLMYWQLTCRAFHTPEEWDFVFKQSGYTGDHEFIFFD